METKNELCYGAKLGAAICLIKRARHDVELKKSLTNLWGYIGTEEIEAIKQNMRDSWHGLGILVNADKIVTWFDNVAFETMLSDREEYRKEKAIIRHSLTLNNANLIARMTDLKRFKNKHKKAIANFDDLRQQYISKAQEYQEIFDTRNVDAITSMEEGIILERDGYERYGFVYQRDRLKHKNPSYTIYEDGREFII